MFRSHVQIDTETEQGRMEATFMHVYKRFEQFEALVPRSMFRVPTVRE